MGRQSIRSRYQRLQRFSDGPFPALTIRYGRRILADYPEYGPAWMLVGIALVELARYEEAEQAFAKAMEHCPREKRQLPLAHMGHLFKEAGDYDQAAEWYRKAIEADPGDATYLIYLGGVLAKQGRFHEAEEAHRAAIECPEGCIDEAYLNLGFVLRARERFREAADCFREAIRLDPEYRAARCALRDVERCIKLEGDRT
jgi:tetratricopeptide (TPR) repeat protein